jgi:glycine hydroxymethyltransferase
MKEVEMRRIAQLIDVTLQAPEDADVSKRVRQEVRELTAAFPLYPEPLEAASP